MSASRFSWRAAPATLPEGLRLYVIGDVHGRADLLGRMFEAIDTHDGADRPAARHEILLGDYVDRGPASRAVIDLVLGRRRKTAVTALAGNHEAMFLEFLNKPETWPAWAAAGGRETLVSYGVAAPVRPADLAELARDARAAIPQEHLAFLADLDLMSVAGGYAFVHAGIRPDRPLDRQVMDDILWIREPFLSHARPMERVIVHGHTPVAEPELLTNRIGIDTGAYASGRLTCLVLEGDRMGFLST